MSVPKLARGSDNHSWPARLLTELQRYEALNCYLRQSLMQRLASDSWFENRVIRYVLQRLSWVRDTEETFRVANLGSALNADEIFRVLSGSAQDFDERLFDALAEVRLIAWARNQGYSHIEKLQTGTGHPTPDFQMEKEGRVHLAEAKHFRVRDYLAYFIADRFEGLAFVTGKLTHFGLDVEISYEYQTRMYEIRKNRIQWVDRARQELTASALSAFEQKLSNDPHAKIPILDGLFVVRRSQSVGPGRVSPALIGSLCPKETAQWCLARLRDDLLGKLGQIKGCHGAVGDHADQAIVFFSGVDEWEPEWSVVWDALDANDEEAWKQVSAIKQAADQLIGIPFELIVGRYQKKGRGPNGKARHGPMQYLPFSWEKKARPHKAWR